MFTCLQLIKLDLKRNLPDLEFKKILFLLSYCLFIGRIYLSAVTFDL